MQYNFDTIIDRRETNSSKWGYLDERHEILDLLSYSFADMDFQCADPIVNAIKQRAEHPIFGYTIAREREYLDSVRHWIKERHQWEIQDDWIVFSPGVIAAICAAIRTFTNIGDHVLYQPPVFPFNRGIEVNGRRPLANKLIFQNGQYAIDFEDFEEKAKSPLVKLFILCSPHNPIGRVWTKEDIIKMGEICLENDVIVVSDEIHNDLILPGNKHTIFGDISEEFANNSLVCTAPTKSFNISGLVISNIIISNEKLRHNFMKTLYGQNGSHIANVFGLEAAKAAYNEGSDWLEQVMKYVQTNFSFLDNYLQQNIPEIELIKPEGTYLAWLDIKQLELDQDQFKEFFLKKAKVIVIDGSFFGEEGKGFMRMNLACPKSILHKGLDRIKNEMDNLENL